MALNDSDSSGPSVAVFVSPGGPITGARLPVRGAAARIGQGAHNDLVLDDDTVSTNHALLEFANGDWRLTDLDSRNGTYLDGVRLASRTPTSLRSGALVGFGGVKLVFEPASGAVPPPPPAAATRRDEPRRPTGFRIPVWVVLLIIIVVAVVVFMMSLGGDPTLTEPLAEPATVGAQAIHYAPQLAA